MKPMASAMISDIGSPSRNHRGALRRADRSQAIAAHPHRMLTYPALEPGRRSIDCRHPLASRFAGRDAIVARRALRAATRLVPGFRSS
jgi:hypothetical protein